MSTYGLIEVVETAQGDPYNTEYVIPDDFHTRDSIHLKADRASSTYMSLKDDREPANVYEQLQPPGGSAVPHARKGGDQRHRIKDEDGMVQKNPAFQANK